MRIAIFTIVPMLFAAIIAGFKNKKALAEPSTYIMIILYGLFGAVIGTISKAFF